MGREVALAFGVSVASALKWSQRLRDTGSAASRPMGGHKRRVLADEQRWMLLRLEECPHLTVRGLAAELAERGHRVSPNSMVIAAPGWSQLQKNAVRQRAGSPEDRAAAGAMEEISGPA